MILSASPATGHLWATDAFITSFQAKGVPARYVEVLRNTNPIFKRIYSDLYIDPMIRQPYLLGSIYKTLDRRGIFRNGDWRLIASIPAPGSLR